MVVANGHAKDLLRRGRQHRASEWWQYLLPQMVYAIEPRHVLTGIALGPKGIGYHAVVSCGVDPATLAADVEALSTSGRTVILPSDHRLPLSSATRKLVERAVDRAHLMNQGWVGTEHLLLSVMETIDGVAQAVFSRRGVTRERVEGFVRSNAKLLNLPSESSDTHPE